MSNPVGLIFMTALLPTIGHQYLIDFADQFMNKIDGKLVVVISTRTKEPINGLFRITAFKEHYNNKNIKFVEHIDDDAPQNPNGDDDKEFWDYWKRVGEFATREKITHVFASEMYGIKLAEIFNAIFIPCDMKRIVTGFVKSSDVRGDIEYNFSSILLEMQKYFKQTVTFFGAESTGKSTATKAFHEMYPSYYTPEWAREYLETIGPELNSEKMWNIAQGQYALQKTVGNMLNLPYVFQDTDLLSTIGYYKILGLEIPSELIDMFNETKSDLYVVMNSGIPFEPDILRYGGDKRESTDQFWIDLLEEFNCNYYVVKFLSLEYQFDEISVVIENLWNKFQSISDFERE